MRRHLVERIEESRQGAVAPKPPHNCALVKSEKFFYASTWPKCHAAYAAGLRTFGLCDGLITARGKTKRAGSIIVNKSIKPTPRPYASQHAYCLFFTDGSCGNCINRCPANAITESGHDKEKCRQHLACSREYLKEIYLFEGYGCGLCQVGVPCESSILVKEARETLERGELSLPHPPLA